MREERLHEMTRRPTGSFGCWCGHRSPAGDLADVARHVVKNQPDLREFLAVGR